VGRSAVEEEGEFGESMHIVQSGMQLLEECRREEPLLIGIEEAHIADLTRSRMSRKIWLGGQSFHEERGVRYGQGGDMAIEQARRYLLERVGDESKSGKGWKCGIGKYFIENLDGKAKL
jgi:hypothetical protein